ncbi:hypothetical protein PC111_g2717 [Phytophthora cactorum]|nr:hypothetical protein PC111_g2717 [Phytophthora cactorum]KAG2925375.1 hypothetical protein PC114_g4110 [Phytophthora cactorum]
MQAIYLRARLSPSSVATSAAVRREELLEYLKQREHRLRNYCRVNSSRGQGWEFLVSRKRFTYRRNRRTRRETFTATC